MQGTEEHVKRHHRDATGKTQDVGKCTGKMARKQTDGDIYRIREPEWPCQPNTM